MKMGYTIVLLLVLAALGAFLFYRLRIRKKRFVSGTSFHPTGYVKYHKNTSTHVRKAISPLEDEEKFSKSIAVLKFKGDLRASSRHSMSHRIDEILLNRDKIESVVILVESPGGSVTDYGHVYSEFSRIRESGLNLTACVDTVAASGGYLVCLPAHKIIAAPFAMIGSIGVVSFMPNIRKLLERFDIQPRTFTAGSYKRTVTLTDDATPEEVAHFQEQLNLIHAQFKQALTTYRPQVNANEVATGDAWLAQTTIDKNFKLVDEIKVSSDYLLALNQNQDLVEFLEQEKGGRLQRYLKMGFQWMLDQTLNAARI